MLLLLTWAAVFALLAIPVAAAHAWLARRGQADEAILIVGPLVFAGVVAYTAFFAFFLHPALGRMFSFSTAIGLGGFLAWHRRNPPPGIRPETFASPALLAFAIGLFYLALLYLPELGVTPEWQSQARFLYQFPIDANLPKWLGDRLYDGESLRLFLPNLGWLSSDRPPLQIGFYLLVRPWLSPIGIPVGLIYQCAGTLAQLIWLPALWMACRALRLGRFSSTVVILLVAASGFLLFNSTYVWPKLLAGGYVLVAAVLLLDRSVPRPPASIGLAGAAAALGWLAHGAVAFSLAPLALLLLVPRWFPGWKNSLLAAAAFGLLALPWTAYQKFYDPPGNRLVKWHLAGVVAVDSRPAWQTIRESYAALPHDRFISDRRANAYTLVHGSFGPVLDVFTSTLHQRRVDEFFYVFRSLGILNLAWVLAPLAWLYARKWPPHFELQGLLLGWTALTLVLWTGLMFVPASTLIHQGSYAAMLSLYLLAIVFLLQLPRWMGGPVLAWHVIGFSVTWLPYFGSAPLDFGMILPFALAAVLLGLALGWPAAPTHALAAAGRALSFLIKIPVAPAGKYPLRAALYTATAVVLVLFVRRPEAFLHPQFWSEDGSIFFLQAEFLGRAALVQSYGGYHLLLLRLVAAGASGLDPLWIPAVYFWASIAIVVAVTLALFSPRLTLSHRPWLALAMVLMPQVGEVFHNLTNAQWVAALGLVLLLLARDPRRGGQWAVDLGVAGLVGLTGLFSILFAPLFVLRAVARRTWAAGILAAVIVATAALQGLALARTMAPSPVGGSGLFEILRTLGQRIWAGLLLPSTLAESAPAGLLIVAGLLVTIALAVFNWQRSGDRPTRLMLWGAAAAVFAATIYKFNGGLDMLIQSGVGERYFFIPKVLILWLLILECDGPWQRFARSACVLSFVASLTAFRFMPYVDYHWPVWAAQIRAGEHAVVPINPEISYFTYPGRPKPAADGK